jgi:2-methylcitrate dehydratase PrpD
VRKHDVRPDQVERIEVWTHPRRLEHTNRPAPKSALDAKFSVQYCLARAVTDRRIMIEHFEGDAYRDAGAQNLLGRVHAAPYGTDRFPADNHFGAEVQVRTRDGATLTEKVDQPFGRTSANPLTKGQLKEKFENCAARVLDAKAVSGLYAAVERFEILSDVRAVTALACNDAAAAQRSVRAARA